MTGILGLQGSFSLHEASLARLGVPHRIVKRVEDLAGCDRLILPGGESTVLSKLLEETGLAALIRERAQRSDLALYGTCAGAILLGREAAPSADEPPQSGRQPVRLALADVEVRRNAYGRQIDSFRGPLSVEGALARAFGSEPFEGFFIRAPRFGRIGAKVETLARESGEPVLVREGRCLLGTFHPELTEDLRVHRFFVERM